MNAPVIIDSPTSLDCDPRFIFLVRAKVRLFLIEQGELTLTEAYDGLVETIHCETCAAYADDMVARWERMDAKRISKRKFQSERRKY
jgi:hypothetical protein